MATFPLSHAQRALLTSSEFRASVGDDEFADELADCIETAGEGEPVDVDFGQLRQRLLEELADFANAPGVDEDLAAVAAEMAAELPIHE